MRISTIIPTYNRASLIGDTLQSILGQTYPPYEVIVVDDGSTDGTAEVVEQYQGRVTLLRQRNLGAGAARNRGFAQSTGDLIHFMDSDDIPSLNTYERQTTLLREAHADMTYGPWVKTHFEDKVIVPQRVVVQQRPIPPLPTMDRWLLRGWVTVFQPCLLRRSLIERVGSYRADLKPSEDSELLYRIGRSGAKIVHTPDTLLLYRVHPQQVTFVNAIDRAIDWVRLLGCLDKHLAADGHLDLLTHIEFALRKIDALRGLQGRNNAIAKELESGVPQYIRALGWALRPLRKISAKARRIRYEDNYGTAFQVGPMTEWQRCLVYSLGYRLKKEG
jgi:glycosyltransferase involved in cell wall biosynthesis